MIVTLRNSKMAEGGTVELDGLVKDKWTEKTIDFTADGGLKKRLKVDELIFSLPKGAAGAELLIDDVLLYEPGAK